jgi:hypothetical protein
MIVNLPRSKNYFNIKLSILIDGESISINLIIPEFPEPNPQSQKLRKPGVV